mgnify:FL=1
MLAGIGGRLYEMRRVGVGLWYSESVLLTRLGLVCLIVAEYSCNERVAALALPVVVACSKTVLHKFVDDDRKAGRMPLPRSVLQ